MTMKPDKARTTVDMFNLVFFYVNIMAVNNPVCFSRSSLNLSPKPRLGLL